METVYINIRYTFRFAFFFISNVYTLPAYLIWMFLLTPLRFLASSLYWSIESRFFRMMQSVVVTWIDSGNYKLLECGEDVGLITDDEACVLVNHQSTADTPLMMLALYSKGFAAGRVMWIMWVLFKYSHFGAASTLRQDFFIDQGKETRNLQLILLKDHLKTAYLHNKRKWIVVFPEGGFLYKRLEASQRYAKKNNFPVLNHATLPRLGALQTILDTVGEPYEEAQQEEENKQTENNNETRDPTVEQKNPTRPVKWVIDVTLGYKGGKPLDMLGMCIGSNPTHDTLLHWRAFKVKDIPREETALRDWLYERYREKDDMLKAYYEDGTIPGVTTDASLPALKTQYLRFDLMELLLNHTFFIVSSYLQCVYLWSPLFSMIGYLFSFVF